MHAMSIACNELVLFSHMPCLQVAMHFVDCLTVLGVESSVVDEAAGEGG